MTMNDSARAFALLKAHGEHVCFAESLTGGLIAATFIENPGASCAVNESYVSYAPEAKMRILGVARETVETVGVVSADCARQMAAGARRISGADWGVSATGLAGPDGGTAETPVGTVFIGVAGPTGTRAFEFHFEAMSRSEVRYAAVNAAFEKLIDCLNAYEKHEA